MTHLRIEQNNGVIEEVSSSIITKLYEIAHAGLDVSSNLLGRLHTPVAYRYEVLYLTSTYPNLYISSDDYAIPFEDPNMVTYLNSIGVGSNGIVTEALAAAATIVANSQNTEVTKFNELRYFTNITSSRGGWTGVVSGYTRFCYWTALEEIDISNFTSLGHVSGSAYEDTFLGCTALKTVTASDKLSKIGCNAFSGCANLEHIIGLSGTILVANNAFYNCSKLPDEDIADVEFEPAYDGTYLRGEYAFEGTNFTEITLSPNTTKIPNKMFYNCINLETVTGLGNVTALGNSAFQSCTNLTTIDLDFSKLTQVGTQVFLSCSSLQSIQDPVAVLGEKMFRSCTSLLSVDLSGVRSDANSGGSWFRECTALTTVTTDWSNSIGHIGGYAFYGCTSLSTIDLTNITSIGEAAFNGCSALTSITGTSGITSIGKNAFNGCANLASTFDFANTTTVQEGAFKNCKYCTFTNLDKVSNFGMSAFSGTNIPTSVLFKDGVSIGMQSFGNSNVLSIEFLGGGTVGHKAFNQSKSLTSITFDTDISLGASCFQECKNLQSVDLSNISEQSLFYDAGYGIGSQFALCTVLSSAILNPNITKLPRGMFSYCGGSNLELIIPAGVTEIEENFLYGTNGVKLTILATTPPTLGSNALYGITWIKVPSGTLSAYLQASGWSSFANKMSEITV